MRTLHQTMRSTKTDDSLYLTTFGMTMAELREHLRPVGEKARENAWSKNSYITYYDETLCPDTNYAIHEYRDRKELVKLENGKSYLVKIL